MENKRIVIKVGTSTLTHKTGKLNIRKVERLVKTISDLQNAGNKILLVSSGAIGLGMSKIGLKQKPTDTPMKQACAAVGQCELMYMYDKLFSEYSLTVAQLLLTKYVLDSDSRKNVENAIESLLSCDVIPIINENDTVAIEELELEIGENDSLSAIIACVAKADLLVILSDIDGLYDSDPHTNKDAKLIESVDEIDERIEKFATGSVSGLGTGGMSTKINAAKIVNEAGIDMIIMNGANPENLYNLIDNKKIGTIFKAKRGAK
ncbi:MAG: glutamate 5-kinase [Clostridia bacterium]|nr:glutamate 5-kinase [Clostridia bacterium]